MSQNCSILLNLTLVFYFPIDIPPAKQCKKRDGQFEGKYWFSILNNSFPEWKTQENVCLTKWLKKMPFPGLTQCNHSTY